MVGGFCASDREYGNLAGNGRDLCDPALSCERIYDLSRHGGGIWFGRAASASCIRGGSAGMAESDRNRSLLPVPDRDRAVQMERIPGRDA